MSSSSSSSSTLVALDVSDEPEDQCATSALCIHRVRFGYKTAGSDVTRWAPSVYRDGRQIWRMLQMYNLHIPKEEHFSRYASSNPALFGAKMEYNVARKHSHGDTKDAKHGARKRRKLDTGEREDVDVAGDNNSSDKKDEKKKDEKKKSKPRAKPRYPINKKLAITLPKINASNRRKKKQRSQSFMERARTEPIRPDQIGKLQIGNVVCEGTAIGNTNLDLMSDWMYAKRQNFPHCAVTVRGKGTVSIYRSNKFSATGPCSTIDHLIAVYLVLLYNVRHTGEYVRVADFESVNMIGTGYAGHKFDLMKRKRRYERLTLCPRYDTGKGAFTGMHVRVGSHKVTVTQHKEGMYNFVGMRDVLEVHTCLHDYVPLIAADDKEIGRGEVYVSDDDELDEGDQADDDEEEVDV